MKILGHLWVQDEKKKEDLKRRDKNWTTEAPTKNI